MAIKSEVRTKAYTVSCLEVSYTFTLFSLNSEWKDHFLS